MPIGPLLRTYLQQPPSDRALYLLFLDDHELHALRTEVMDILDIVQDALIDILAELHGEEPASAESLAALTAVLAALGVGAA